MITIANVSTAKAILPAKAFKKRYRKLYRREIALIALPACVYALPV
ncbi:MAG: hypothetical protein M3R50_04510 [Bacteroidota bacterium]|nr:hypothetical protein [Bacteroidota bacterium]